MKYDGFQNSATVEGFLRVFYRFDIFYRISTTHPLSGQKVRIFQIYWDRHVLLNIRYLRNGGVHQVDLYSWLNTICEDFQLNEKIHLGYIRPQSHFQRLTKLVWLAFRGTLLNNFLFRITLCVENANSTAVTHWVSLNIEQWVSNLAKQFSLYLQISIICWQYVHVVCVSVRNGSTSCWLIENGWTYVLNQSLDSI